MSIGDLQSIVDLEQSIEQPFSALTSTYCMIADAAKNNPNAPALSFFLNTDDYATPVTWSYTELLAEITQSANLLRRLGLRKGEVVAYVLPNLPETHLAVWGGETAGIAFAVNTSLDGEQMGELLREAGTRWIITTGPAPEPEIWDRVSAAINCTTELKAQLQGILAVDPLRHQSSNERGCASGVRAKALPTSLAGIAVYDFHVELAAESGTQLNFPPPRQNETASYFCTGGTTGLPKIAMHTHRNETANATQLAAVFEGLFCPGRTFLSCLPLFHVNAQLASGLAAFAAGAHVLLGPPAGYRAEGLIARFWEVCAYHKVAAFSGVPTVFAGLLQAPTHEHDLSSLHYAICGAAPMPVELFNQFEAQTGVRIIEGYGLTESSAVASLNPALGESRVGSIGLRLPWMDMSIVILDEEGVYLRLAAVDEVGVVAIRGANVFSGYINALHNESVWINTPDSPEHWLNTGDLGRMDAEGFFWLTGRKKELIIRGGHNIDPKAIEEVFAAHSAVSLSAAVGRPDAHAGEVPVVYVQLQPSCQVTEKALLAYAQQNISERAAVPKFIRIVDALPVTAVGKIYKPELMMREVETVLREEALKVGVELSAVNVEQHPQQGLVARAKIEAGDAAELTAMLGRYTFKCRLD